MYRIQILYVRFFIIMTLLMINNVFGGSNYQIQGLGSVNTITQADAMGRGGTAFAIIDGNTINSINPANLIFINHTKISADFLYDNIKLKTTIANGLSNYSNLNGAKLAIPIAIDKLVVSLGIKPFTKSDFESELSGTLSTGKQYIKRIIDKGGLNQFSLGVATGFKNRYYTGFFLHYNFGRVEENWRVDFNSTLYKDTSDKILSTLWGGSFTAGLMIKITPDLYMGGIYSQPIKLSVNNHIDYTFGLSSETSNFKMKIPYSWGIGTSYTLRGIRFSLDYFNQPWSKLIIDGSKLLHNYNDSHNIFGGIEILPSKKLIVNYFRQITYRAGIYYSKLSYLDISGNDVAEYMGTLGFGFPFYKRFGRIDVAIGIGKRGNLDKNSVEETLLRLMISVSGGEKWFLRLK